MSKPDEISQDAWDLAIAIETGYEGGERGRRPVFIARALMAAKRESLERAAKMAEDGFWAAESLSPGSSTTASKAVWRGKYQDGPALAKAIRDLAVE